MECRRVDGDDVGEAQAAQNLHETQGQSTRLYSPCRAAFLRMHSRKFRKSYSHLSKNYTNETV